MCPRCQDAGRTGARPAREYGFASQQDRWEGVGLRASACRQIFSSDYFFRRRTFSKRLLIERHATTPFAAIGDRGYLRNAAEFQEDLA